MCYKLPLGSVAHTHALGRTVLQSTNGCFTLRGLPQDAQHDILLCAHKARRGLYLCCWLIWGRFCRSILTSPSCCWTPCSCVFSCAFSSSSSESRVVFLARVRRADSLLLAFLQAQRALHSRPCLGR